MVAGRTFITIRQYYILYVYHYWLRGARSLLSDSIIYYIYISLLVAGRTFAHRASRCSNASTGMGAFECSRHEHRTWGTTTGTGSRGAEETRHTGHVLGVVESGAGGRVGLLRRRLVSCAQAGAQSTSEWAQAIRWPTHRAASPSARPTA